MGAALEAGAIAPEAQRAGLDQLRRERDQAGPEIGHQGDDRSSTIARCLIAVRGRSKIDALSETVSQARKKAANPRPRIIRPATRSTRSRHHLD